MGASSRTHWLSSASEICNGGRKCYGGRIFELVVETCASHDTGELLAAVRLEGRPNVLLVHHDDLKADLPSVAVPADLWPALVEAAGFAAMCRDGAALMGSVAGMFRGGAARFFHQSTKGRWRGVFRAEDLALYDAKLRADLPPACALGGARPFRHPTA